MSENTNMETQQQTTTPTPEETGGRMFTQEEVNRIVSDRLAREREKLADGSEYKAQYEAVKKELEGIRAEQSRAAKEAAVRAYYQSKNITGKALDIAMLAARAEIDGLTIDGGKIVDTAALDTMIAGALAPLVSKTVTVGANTATPPACTGGGADRLADAFKPPKI